MGSGRDKRKKRQKSMKPGPDALEKWRDKTDAAIMTEAAFFAQKQAEQWYILGVMGFAGSWRRSGLSGDPLAAYIEDIRAAITAQLSASQAQHGQHLVVSSGATDLGVLQVTYEVCTTLGILALGITPNQTLRYSIGRLDMLIPYGHRYGDESQIFLNTADELMLLGGGPQSKRETLQGHRMGLPVTVIQGFGGVADEFTEEDLPGAVFIQRQESR